MVSTFHRNGVTDHCICFFSLTSKALFNTATTKKKGKETTNA